MKRKNYYKRKQQNKNHATYPKCPCLPYNLHWEKSKRQNHVTFPRIKSDGPKQTLNYSIL